MQHNFRVDIQALRGLAVLLVVFFHAHTPRIDGGYLGVDIFFVISGYLITSQVAKSVSSGNFTFIDFYSRRALRLFPAAYVVFIACFALAPWLLNSVEWGDFLAQLAGAVMFVANIVLWQQTDYFSPTAEYKVLLHTWSLSIEEQYYLLLPATLVFVKPKYWLGGAIVITVLSLALYSLTIGSKPISAFFWLPTRAWELGIGSALALICLKTPVKTPNWLCVVAVCVLLIIPVFPLQTGAHNEITILLVCLAAAVVISANAGWVNNNPVSRVLAAFGTISYSLYLVHWPVFSFLHNANIAEYLSLPARIFGLIVSVLLAIVLYRTVEQSFRVTGKDTVVPVKKLIALLFVSALLIVATLVTMKSLSHSEFSHRMRFNFGISDQCNEHNFDKIAECRTSDEPEILLWGDSFAMHLGSGIAQTPGSEMIQATFSACAGVKDIALVRPPREVVAWSRRCADYNKRVLEYLSGAESIKIVIMASQWSYFFNEQSIFHRPSDKILPEYGASAVVPYIKSTVEEIRELGKAVVFVEPPPWGDFDFGRCHERKRTGKLSFGAGKECLLTREAADRVRVQTDALMDLLNKDEVVPMLKTRDLLCDDKQCKTVIDDVILYRDHSHFSYEGSVKFAQDLQIVKKFYELSALPVPAAIESAGLVQPDSDSDSSQ